MRIVRHAARIALLGALLAGPAWAIEIAREGKSQAAIVTGPAASAPIRRAAEELRRYLGRVTGADLPVVESAESGRPRILLGRRAAALADPQFTAAGLGEDGVVLRTVGNDLILAGGEPRGTLYAAYTFLEDQAGVHWWAPDAETVPQRPTLRIDALDRRYVPVFDYREPYWETALNRDWAARNKVLGAHARLDESTGGGPAIASATHSFSYLLPARRYFEAHPEWFSEVDGKRIREGGQLCLSNPDMVRELTANVLAQLRRSRRPTQVSVAQNDGGRPCQCAKCRAIDAEEGSPSGAILRMVNAVAEAVAKEFPQVVVSTFAYTYSEPAPRITRPRENVAVWLCTMNCSYNLPLAEHKRNEKFARDLQDWSRICQRLYIWDYTTNFRHYLFIHPNLRVLGPNIRFFRDHHVRGVFEQGATGTPGAEFGELRAWVLAKLLWDPSLDDGKLVDEFLDGYYGAGGRQVRAYIDTIHDIMQQGRQPLGCYEEPDRRFMNIDTLSKAWAHLRSAEQAVETDPALRGRVRLAQAPVMYAFMIRWADLRRQAAEKKIAWPLAEDPRAVLADYRSRLEAIGVKRVSEQETFDKLEARLKLPPK
jgi:hypothetical protein